MQSLKYFLAIIAFTFYLPLSGQVKIEPGVKDRYEKVAQKLPSAKEEEAALPEPYNGIALFIQDKIDTLNLQELRHPDVQINDVNDTKSRHQADDSILGGGLFVFSGTFDSFKITFSSPWGTNMEHVATPAGISTTYVMDKPDGSSKRMQVIEQSVSFHKKDFRPGEVVYGEVTFITAEVREKDAAFTSGELRMRQRITYLFKASPKPL